MKNEISINSDKKEREMTILRSYKKYDKQKHIVFVVKELLF